MLILEVYLDQFWVETVFPGLENIETVFLGFSDFKSIFKVISDCLPKYRIIQNNDDDPSCHDWVLTADKLDEPEIETAKIIFNTLISESGNKTKAFNKLMSIEPFCYFESQLKEIFNE